MTSHVLDANITAFKDHLDTFVDPELLAIDQELLDDRTDPTASATWEVWNAAYRALEEALGVDAPRVKPLLDAVGDATGDLFAASDTAAFVRGVGLACTMRPAPVHPDGISPVEAFQMTPLPDRGTGTV